MAASPKSPPYHLLALVIVIFIAAASSICDSSGFSSTLIHRDHPKSPLYNPNLTKWERVEASVRRSFPRMKSLANTIQQSNTPGDILSFMFPHGGEYLMEFKMGNPSVKIFGIIDTGSDLTWVHCKPCLSSNPKQCWDPYSTFDPSRSITYQDQECSKSESCMDISPMFSCNDTCKYTVKYGDDTISRGNVARINIGFSPKDSYSIIFGCGHENVFTTPLRYQGLVGLGKGRLSLINQLEIKSFSHCFDKNTDVSMIQFRPVMRFGTESILDGGKTPLLEGRFMDQHYFLHLEGISVGHQRVELEGYTFNLSEWGTKGFITDTGTSYSRLEKQAYDAVVNSMTSAVTLEPCATEYEGRLKPCYCSITMQHIQVLAPALTYHFGGGLNLTIDKANTWVEVESDKYCLALVDSGKDGMSILGNYNQININVGYDLVKKEIHFEPMNNCISTYGHVCLEGLC